MLHVKIPRSPGDNSDVQQTLSNRAAGRSRISARSAREIGRLVELAVLVCVLIVATAVVREWEPRTLPALLLFSFCWLAGYAALTRTTNAQAGMLPFENALHRKVGDWCKAGLAAVIIAFAVKTSEDLSRLWVATSLFSGLMAIGAVRILAERIGQRMLRDGTLGNRIAIYGISEYVIELSDKLQGTQGHGHCIDSVFDEREPRTGQPAPSLPVRHGLDELLVRAKQGEIDTVLINLPWSAQERIREISMRLEEVNVDVLVVPPRGLTNGRHLESVSLGSIQALALYLRPVDGIPAMFKIVMDRLAALIALVLLAPLLALVALAIKLESPGPVFFRQKRRGMNNEPFFMWKFRSMHHRDTDHNATRLAVRGDKRITRVGAVIRRLSIDELPQLLNILTGSMSLVGPRPHAYGAKAADRLYEDVVGRYNARHRVLPGLTGLAQVRGYRGNTTEEHHIENRIASDLEYMERWSLSLDLSILVRTGLTVLFHREAY